MPIVQTEQKKKYLAPKNYAKREVDELISHSVIIYNSDSMVGKAPLERNLSTHSKNCPHSVITCFWNF